VKASKPLMTVERLSVWSLPLVTLSVLLGGLIMALRLGQMRWATAGITVYVVCLAMWLTATIVRGRMPAPALATSRPVGQATSEPESLNEPLQFMRFANWFFPVLAILILTVSSFLAAARGQQSWLTAAAVSFSGCFLLWAGKLFLPLAWRRTGTPLPPNYAPLYYMPLLAMLLFSFLTLGLGLLWATKVLDMRWLVLAGVSFCANLIVATTVSVRVDGPEQPGSGLIWMVTPGVVLGVLTAGLALAAYFHRMSWVAAGIVGSSACLVVWLVQIVRATRKAVPPATFSLAGQISVPAILLTGLLAFLVFAWYQRELSALKAAVLALLGGLVLWFSWMFVVSIERDGSPTIESNWAGLGGGLGGWRCSASLVYALCALALAVCAGVAFRELQRSSPPQVTQSNK
jgi:hypothetical protein